jgi:eukaryotic-like serine/threonine-protein kinase
VLYEMLSGKKAFGGSTTASVIAAIMEREPEALQTAPPLDRVIRTCLAKDPDERFQNARDLKRDLMWAMEGDSATAPSRSGFSRLTGIAAAVLAIVAAGLGFGLYRATRPAELKPLVRLDVDLGADVSLPAAGNQSSVAVSPDGKRLVYVSGAPTKLFTRRLDQPKANELPGTQGAAMPFFSPDGQWVGFIAGAKLSKISVEGGVAVPLGEIGAFGGASWGEDGSILVADVLKGLVRIPAGGGAPEMAAEEVKGEVGFTSPWILPGGKAVLFTRYTAYSADAARIEVMTLADRRRRVVVPGGNSPRYLPAASSNGAASGGAGHLVYVNKATMFAVPFDPAKLETRGIAVPVLEDVAWNSRDGIGQFDFSRTGTLVYRRSGGSVSGNMTTLQWVDATGKKEPLPAKPGVDADPALSPDGKRVALSITEGGSTDIWVYNPQRDAMTRLTFGGGVYQFPVWSPDGQYVVFAYLGNGILQARADGAGPPQALTESKGVRVPGSFTPDGKRLAYHEIAGKYQIWTVPLEEQGGQLKAGKPEQFLKSGFNDGDTAFSPDGRWLAYQSDESGKDEVYVRAFPSPASGQGGKWQISNSGGQRAHWSRTGHELMFQSGDQIMAASYTVKGDVFLAEKPRVWISKLDGTQWGSGVRRQAPGGAEARGIR